MRHAFVPLTQDELVAVCGRKVLWVLLGMLATLNKLVVETMPFTGTQSNG